MTVISFADIMLAIDWLAIVVHGMVVCCSYSDFLSYTRQKKNKTYILKPENGCQGKGIWLTKSPKDIKPSEHMLCQQYLSKVGGAVFRAMPLKRCSQLRLRRCDCHATVRRPCRFSRSLSQSGSVAEWLACWTQAQ